MWTLHTAKVLRFALATLFLAIGIGFLAAGGVGRLEEDSHDDAGAEADVEAPEGSELQEKGGALVHGSTCSSQRERRA